MKFDGQEIAKYSDLPPLITKRKAGDLIEIELLRDGKPITLKARLGDMNY